MSPWMAAIGPMQQAGTATGGAIGGMIGNSEAGGDQNSANQAILQAQQIIDSVQIPDPATLQVVLDHLQQQGQLTPELQSALTQQASSLGGFTPSQPQQDAQKAALQSMMQTGKVGLNATDRAAMADIQNQNAQQVRGQEQGVIQNMAQRGMGGSGNELAARLQAGQSGAQNSMLQGNQVAAQSQQRALNAVAQSGQLGGQMTAADFSRAQGQSAAQDAINRFNTQNSQQVQSSNVASNNAAQQANLANKQNIANQNVGLSNQQQMYNKQVLVDDYNRRMQKAQAQAGIRTGAVNQMYNQNAQATRNQWAGIGAAVGGGAGAMASQPSSNAPTAGTQEYQTQQEPNTGQPSILDTQYSGMGS